MSIAMASHAKPQEDPSWMPRYSHADRVARGPHADSPTLSDVLLAPVPDRIERQLVVEQLRSGGVIEALHVQRAGFPCRTGRRSHVTH